MESLNDRLVRWWCLLNSGTWPDDLATPPSQQRDEAAQWGAFCVVSAMVSDMGLEDVAERTWEQQYALQDFEASL